MLTVDRRELAKLWERYCEEAGTNTNEVEKTKLHSGTEHRSIFAMIAVLIYFPEFKDPYVRVGSGLITTLSKIYGRSMPGTSRLTKNARFYYQRYSDFKKKVDDYATRIAIHPSQRPRV